MSKYFYIFGDIVFYTTNDQTVHVNLLIFKMISFQNFPNPNAIKE